MYCVASFLDKIENIWNLAEPDRGRNIYLSWLSEGFTVSHKW